MPDKLLTMTESGRHDDGFTTSYLAQAPIDTVLRVRARTVLAAARPGFREWLPSAHAPVLRDSAMPPTTTGPLVGDFEGEGMPDVVFDGYDGRIMVTPAVLSNNGRQRDGGVRHAERAQKRSRASSSQDLSATDASTLPGSPTPRLEYSNFSQRSLVRAQLEA